jgi:integrase/recombinase XerD
MYNLVISYENFLSENVSENTKISYLSDLNKFLDATNVSDEKDVLAITNEDIEGYITSLKNKGMAYSSISRIIASMKKFFTYCKSRELIETNPVDGIEMLPIQRKLPNTLTSEQVVKLIEAPDLRTPRGKRDRAMLEVLYASGAKVSELISLRVNDVSLKTEVVTLSGSSKKRVVPLGRAAVDALSDYIKNARGEMMRTAESDILFVNFHGQPLTRQGFWKIIKGYITQVGIKGSITAQTLRHCFALHLLENGADTRSVSEMLGYSDVSSARIYVDVMNSKIKKVYKNAHPRA